MVKFIQNRIFIFIYLCSPVFSALPELIYIGGFFSNQDKMLQMAFEHKINYINEQNIFPGTTLVHVARLQNNDDSFQADKEVCRMLQMGVVAIFGPQSERSSNHIQSICDAKGLPYFNIRWDDKPVGSPYALNLHPDPELLGQAYYDVMDKLNWKEFVIIFDSPMSLFRMKYVLRETRWYAKLRQLDDGNDWRVMLKALRKERETKFVIDVEHSKLHELLFQAMQMGLMREYYSYFITSLDIHLVDMKEFGHDGTNITSLRLFDPETEQIKTLEQEWKYRGMKLGLETECSRLSSEAAMILDGIDLLVSALASANKAENFDLPGLDCDTSAVWRYGQTLVDYMKNITKPQYFRYPIHFGNNYGGYNTRTLYRGSGNPLHQELENDADNRQKRESVNSEETPYNYGLYNAENVPHAPENAPYNPGNVPYRPGYDPYGTRNYPHGAGNKAYNPGVIDYNPSYYGGSISPRRYNQSRTYYFPAFEEITGVIGFDERGVRTDFELEITELNGIEGMKKVGEWSRENGANYTRNAVQIEKEKDNRLVNKTLIVTTVLTEPYSMRKLESGALQGNDRYEGFCIDLVDRIAREKQFKYIIRPLESKKYGSKIAPGEWNGMIGELLSHRADLAIVDFTITYERESVVDFSMPFMNLGISIIYTKPQKKTQSLFSFLSPFSEDVWIYMATAYLGVSILLYMLARISPKEWDNPHPCIQDPDELENAITMSNAFWFTIGSLMQQGSDIAPKALSTRIVAGIWWFFTLIMISSYTANLAAFLTVERMDSPIDSAEDLAKQTKIKYGCKEGGSTYSFFEESTIPVYKKMFATMNSQTDVYTDSNEEGVEKVAKGKGSYAFFMESSSIEYEIERKCNLMQVGGLLDSKSYGIALPPESPYTEPISAAILKLKEEGVIHELKTKWWKQKRDGGQCVSDDDQSSSSTAAELGLANVGGVFVVLLGGMFLAALSALFEFFWNARKLATADHIDSEKGKAENPELGLDNVGGVFILMLVGMSFGCVLACCEFMWKVRKLAVLEGDSFYAELLKDLKFVCTCSESQKPARKYASAGLNGTSPMRYSSSASNVESAALTET